MRLPKWVVKWVKDNFDVNALELKAKQQEEKIKKLNKEIVLLKWRALPEDERKWALDAFFVLTGKLFPCDEQIEFMKKYIEQQEMWDVINSITSSKEELPF